MGIADSGIPQAGSGRPEDGAGRIVARRKLTTRDWLTLVVLPGVFVIGGIVMIAFGEGSDWVGGTAAVVFFGGGAAAALWIKYRDAVPLIVDERGMRNGRKTFDLTWDQIDGVYTRGQYVGMLRYGWLAIATDVPGPGRLAALGGVNAAMIDIPRNAAQHLIQWDGGIRPDLDEIAATIRSHGVPVDDE